MWTYSYLAVLVPVFLLTDWLRYKPVVVFQCTALLVTTAMLLWLKGVPEMQAVQFTYGVVTSCDVAYFTYIYSMVELKHYLKATSYCRTAQLLGYTVGSVLGQVLVSFELLSYKNILVFTLVITSIAWITSILLPLPKTSMFFHQRRRDGGEEEDNVHEGSVCSVGPLEPEALEMAKGSLTKDVTQNNERSSFENHLDDVKVDESAEKQTKNYSDNNSARNSKTGKIISLLLFKMCIFNHMHSNNFAFSKNNIYENNDVKLNVAN